MKIHLYTEEEIKKLKQSIFIRNVKYKRELEYDPIFKLWTIVLKHDCPNLSAREIFARGGIDINILHKRLPQRRIGEWMDNYKRFGIKYFWPEDEPYESIKNKKETNNSYDSLQEQVKNFVLERLEEINNEENR